MKIADEMVERAARAAWIANPAVAITGDKWDTALDKYKQTYRAEARAVLEYAATLGPTREERLVQYRCAAPVLIGSDHDMSHAAVAGIIENYAHAMLAAERAAAAPPCADASVLLEGISRVIEMLHSAEDVAHAEAIEMLSNLLPTDTP